METKNNLIYFSLAFLVVGLLFGWLIWGTPSFNQNGMHMMSDGTMMSNKGMSMSHTMDQMMQQLYGKTGDDLDKAFLTEMIVHHEGAVEMAEYALRYAKHQEIKDLSTAIISAQNKEIADMKTWLSQWYGGNR